MLVACFLVLFRVQCVLFRVGFVWWVLFALFIPQTTSIFPLTPYTAIPTRRAPTSSSALMHTELEGDIGGGGVLSGGEVGEVATEAEALYH